MKKIFTYKNVITLLTIITVWFMLFIIWDINKKYESGSRYQLFNTKDENLLILLDRKTGLTWRNIWNNNQEKLPTTWERMNYYATDIEETPIGVQKLYINLCKKNGITKKEFNILMEKLDKK